MLVTASGDDTYVLVSLYRVLTTPRSHAREAEDHLPGATRSMS
jgi:hypothetical protein